MKKLILRNFYVILVGAFSTLSGIIIGIMWLFYDYSQLNSSVAAKNEVSIFTLNSLLVGIGIITIGASIYYYREASKEDKDKQYIPPAT